jgi:gliding motility-associated-like protein
MPAINLQAMCDMHNFNDNFYNPKTILTGVGILLLLLPVYLGAQSPPIRMDSVSVVNNNVMIGWTLGEGIENGYVEIHRRQDNGLYALIQKVPMPQSYFIDTGVDPRQKAFSYYVVAYDSQENLIGSIANNAHQTIYLKEPIADICGRQVSLNWDNYRVTKTVGAPDELLAPFQYNLASVSYNDSDFQFIGEIDFTINQQIIESPNEGDYCFFVRSINKETGATSTSNTRCLHVNFPPHPDFVYVRGVTVEEGHTLVRVATDPFAKDIVYVVQKLENEQFQPLDTLIIHDGAFTFADYASRADNQPETYRVLALDSCLDETVYSQNATSMYLSVNAISATNNYLQWNNYKGWPGGVSVYVVQRQVNSLIGFEEVATLPDGALQFTDDVSSLQFEGVQSRILYRIFAKENSGNPLGFTDTVYSNIAAIQRDVEVFVPNAFRPDSHIQENRIFKPVFTFFTPEKYTLQIFNRWGQLIFQSENFWEGWDGTLNGSMANAGVYAYIIRYSDSMGESFEKRGALLLTR